MSVVTIFFKALALAILAQVLIPPCNANQSGWFLDQRNPINGPSLGYVSAKGCKFVHQKQGYTFVTSAPDWQAVVFNDDSKIYFKTTPKDYVIKLTQTIAVSGSQYIDTALWIKAPPCLLNGRPAVKYVYHAKKAGANPQTAECWFSKDIPVPPVLAELASGIERVPLEPHMLVRLVHHKAPGWNRIMLDTAVAKKVTIPPDCFSYPKDYRLAKNHMEVVMGGLGQEVIDQIVK
jgi:hypothetical protein